MKQSIICLLLLIGATYCLHAQDKIFLRNGRSIEVKVQRSLNDRVEYNYPGETSIYERPKTAISYILYEDGRREVCDENMRSSQSNTSSRTSSAGRTATNNTATSARNRASNNAEVFWQDVKTTFVDSDVKNMSRLQRISAVSDVSYKDAIQQLKRKAAAIGGTTVLVMDDPNDRGNDIEVMGIAYRDESMEYAPRSANERSNTSTESDSNARRRRIAQQMSSYNNDSDLDFEDYSNSSPRNTRNTSSSSRNNNSSRQDYDDEDDRSSDAIYLTNGRVIRGTIEEFEPDDFVSVRTSAGRVYEYSMDDVKRVSHGRSARSSSSARNNKTAANKSQSSRSSSRYDDDDRYSNNRSSSRYEDDDYSISGYKGTFDVGYNLTFGGEKGIIELSTSHGYQINTNLFVGAGVGWHIYMKRDPLLKSNMGSKTYPQYANGATSVNLSTDGTTKLYPHSYRRAIDSSFMMLPIFVDIRGYLPMSSPITPFASAKVGYTFNISDGFGGAGIYMAPSVGAKYNITPRIGLTLSIGYTFQGLGESGTITSGSGNDAKTTIKGGYGYYTYKDDKKEVFKTTSAQGIHIKLGVEF